MYLTGTKLGVNKLLYIHVGTYLGNGQVFHNHWKNGAEIISLQEFSNGKDIIVLNSGVDNVPTFFNRIQHLLTNRQPYSFVKNNCEHAASYAREGVASSPQLALYGLAIGLSVGALLLARRAKA